MKWCAAEKTVNIIFVYEDICNALSSSLSNQKPPICRCSSYWKIRIPSQLELIVESLYMCIFTKYIHIYTWNPFVLYLEGFFQSNKGRLRIPGI